MDDLISRKAAIDEINERQRKLIYCFGFENDVVKIMDIAKSIITALPSAQPDLSEYSDKLWQAAYERGKAEAQPDLDEVYAHAETEAEFRFHAEIVRCKDCAKREYCRTSTAWAVAPSDNWYCADAERRTDDR